MLITFKAVFFLFFPLIKLVQTFLSSKRQHAQARNKEVWMSDQANIGSTYEEKEDHDYYYYTAGSSQLY